MSSQQAIVTFDAPLDNGGAAIAGYTVTSTPDSITATGASSPIIVTGLTNDVDYTFTVHATNINGDGPESTPSNAVMPGLPPDAPTNIVFVDVNTLV
jgi:hypothetical protein